MLATAVPGFSVYVQDLQHHASAFTIVCTDMLLANCLGWTNAELCLLPKLDCPGALPVCPGADPICPGLAASSTAASALKAVSKPLSGLSDAAQLAKV